MIRILDLGNRLIDRSTITTSEVKYKPYYAISTTRSDTLISDDLLSVIDKQEVYDYMPKQPKYKPDIIIYSISKCMRDDIDDLIDNIKPDIIINGEVEYDHNSIDPTSDEIYNNYSGNKIFYLISDSTMKTRSNITQTEITTCNIGCWCHADDYVEIFRILCDYIDCQIAV
jgi:hypothetical protein